MYDYDEENDWFLAEKTWEEYYNEGFEYAIWGVYGNDTDESLLATKNAEGQLIKSRDEANQVIDAMLKSVEAGQFLPVRNIRIQEINMSSGDVVSMFVEAVN